MMLRTFFSRTAKHAKEMCKHVLKILNHQRDVLTPAAVEAVEKSRRELLAAIQSGATKEALQKQMANLETAANKWFKPYPHSSIRENVEVFLVAVAVAMGIRTFFLQPFKIPTGSMQPTLYGITHEDLRGNSGAKIPNGFARFYDSWVHGVTYYHEVAKTDGTFQFLDEAPKRVAPFVTKLRFAVGDSTYTVWRPPDNLFGRAGVFPGQQFRQGEDILKLKVRTGDHLFVDRLTYNFRRPQRGEIIVFETRGIEGMIRLGLPQDQFYIKRLVALGGERVRIGDDRHLIINGQRLDASTPHFGGVYSFTGSPRDSQYSGHVNEKTGVEFGRPGLARLFYNASQEFVMAPNHYLVMGDNTMNSQDSRTWGDFSYTNVIGKSCFVYWPFGDRFGWGNH